MQRDIIAYVIIRLVIVFRLKNNTMVHAFQKLVPLLSDCVKIEWDFTCLKPGKLTFLQNYEVWLKCNYTLNDKCQWRGTDTGKITLLVRKKLRIYPYTYICTHIYFYKISRNLVFAFSARQNCQLFVWSQCEYKVQTTLRQTAKFHTNLAKWIPSLTLD